MKNFLNKKYLIIGGIVLLVIIIGLFVYLNTKESSTFTEEVVVDEIKEIVEEDKNNTLEKCYVKVDVKGYVNNPGLYELECDNRVIDAINKAGGLKKNANTSVINLGKKIFDQMVIIIYSNDEVRNFTKVKEEERIKEEKCINNNTSIKNDACIELNDSKKEVKEEVTSSSKKVSLNNATLEELMTLTGIGESKAINIISYRETNNGFKNIEEIMNISGIGEKAYEKIKDNLTL